jgi:DNA-binding beta-propeller fold protein YncE
VLHAVTADGTIASAAAVESPVLGRKFVHGVRFSPDGRYLVVTQFTPRSSIVVLDAHTLAIVREIPTAFVSPDVQLAKAVCFSLDGRFVIAAYSKAATLASSNARAVIAVHAYANDTGEFSPPLRSTTD